MYNFKNESKIELQKWTNNHQSHVIWNDCGILFCINSSYLTSYVLKIIILYVQFFCYEHEFSNFSLYSNLFSFQSVVEVCKWFMIHISAHIINSLNAAATISLQNNWNLHFWCFSSIVKWNSDGIEWILAIL